MTKDKTETVVEPKPPEKITSLRSLEFYPVLPKGRKYFCSANNCWGISDDATAAVRRARQNHSRHAGPFKFLLYNAPEDTRMDEFGRSTYRVSEGLCAKCGRKIFAHQNIPTLWIDKETQVNTCEHELGEATDGAILIGYYRCDPAKDFTTT